MKGRLILWHDNGTHITVEGGNFSVCQDTEQYPFTYRWVELDTGQVFNELDGWHYKINYYDGTYYLGWERYYEE